MEAKAVVRSGPPPPQKAPWLIFFSHGKRRRSHTYYSISEGRCYVRNIPEFRGKNCLVSSHGWLCMKDWETSDMWLINSVSMEMIDLPTLLPSSSLNYRTSCCMLSGPPTDPTCVVLFIDYLNPVIMYWHQYCRKWEEMKYKLNEDAGIGHCVAIDGKIYGATYEGVLIVIEFNPDPEVKITEIVEPDAVPFMRTAHSKFVVESCGEIFLVCEIFFGDGDVVHTFEVFKLAPLEMKWVCVESLGDRAFFLEDPVSVSCCASEAGVKAGCIYYLCPKDPVLYRFDMADGSISMDVPWPKVSTPWSDVHWVMPSS